MTTETERAEGALQAALTSLLFEFDALSERRTRHLRKRYHHLGYQIDKVARTRQEFYDAVFVEAQARLRDEAEEDDSLICCVQIAEDGGPVWYCFPEANAMDHHPGMISLLSRRHNGSLLIRSIPLDYVYDIRNAPRDSTFVATCTEWTLENQGLPSWEEELDSPETTAQIEALARGNVLVSERIRHWLADEGEMPTEEQIAVWRNNYVQTDEAATS